MSKILERLHHVDKAKDESPEFLRPNTEKKELPPRARHFYGWGILLMVLAVVGILTTVSHLMQAQIQPVKVKARIVKKVSVQEFDRRYEELLAQIASKNKSAQDNFHVAENHLRQWSADYPENTRLSVTLAYVLKQSGRLEEARRILEVAVVFDREDALAWNNLGMVYADLNSYSESIDALNESLSIEKKKEVLLNLAHVYERAENFKASQETLEQYIQAFSPKDSLKAAIKNRMRLLSSLAYLQSSGTPPSNRNQPLPGPSKGNELRAPAQERGK